MGITSERLVHTDQCRQEKVLELDIDQRARNVDKPIGQQRGDTQEEQIVEQVALVLGDLFGGVR
jgi:hypothetical protein